MRYIDSHAHILSEEFTEDYEEMLVRAENAGVQRIMIVCTRAEEARRAMVIAEKDPYRFQAAYGIHPEDVTLADEDALKEVEEIASDPRISAVGEIGLDYYWDKEHREEQRELFIRQIEIAKRVGKPILVHSREAMQDTFDIMKTYRTPGLMHCFAGSAEMAAEFTKLGYYIALGGAVTFKNARHAPDVCRTMDLRYLLTETDCPYMSPVPLRGKRNEPGNIPYIARRLAEIRGISEEDMTKTIYRNYARFLGEEDADQ